MAHKKLIRFEAIRSFPNVLQYPANMPGRWKDHFGNTHPITLELACGKGEYTTGLSARYPNRNFIGVDVKGNRMFIGAEKCLKAGITNAAFLRTQIEKLRDYFEPGEVSDIWIIFPDPFLRDSKAKNRLTHHKFLLLYQQVLTPGGIIHLKTDSTELYRFTLETIRELGCSIVENVQDVYAAGITGPLTEIQTHYEGLHLADGRIIKYISFTLPDVLPPWIKKKKTDHEQKD
jgi:tRNA (guanine-N7-)-methyltransferase